MPSDYHLGSCLPSLTVGLEDKKRAVLAPENGSQALYKGESCLKKLAESQGNETLAIWTRVFTEAISKSYFSGAGDSLHCVFP